MAIELNWINYNSAERTLQDIYRSTEDIPETIIDNPLVTLPGDVKKYYDLDTVFGVTYNYRIRIYVPGGDFIISRQFTKVDLARTGPGPISPINRDVNLTWNGSFEDTARLPTTDDLKLFYGLDDIDFPTNDNIYHKIVNANKIYYISQNKYIPFKENSDVLINHLRSTSTTTLTKGVDNYKGSIISAAGSLFTLELFDNTIATRKGNILLKNGEGIVDCVNRLFSKDHDIVYIPYSAYSNNTYISCWEFKRDSTSPSMKDLPVSAIGDNVYFMPIFEWIRPEV